MFLKIVQFLSSLLALSTIGLIWPFDALSSDPPCFEDRGGFTTSLIDEASGLALIPKGEEGAGGFYVTNDSGDLPRFFRTARDGKNVIEFRIDGWKPFDAEDLAVGPCPSGLNGRCLAIADIGDNRSRRKKVEIGLIELGKLKVPAGKTSIEVRLDRKVTFTYPDRPHNAEAFALLAGGIGMIITKEQDKTSKSSSIAQVFSIDLNGDLAGNLAGDLKVKKRTSTDPGLSSTDFKAEAVGRGGIDVPSWTKDQGLGGLVTGLSVANPETVSLSSLVSSGSSQAASAPFRFLVLTYRSVVEVDASWTLGQLTVVGNKVVRFDSMEQQEAITYDEGTKGFFVASEAPLSTLKWLGVSNSATSPIRYVWPSSCKP